MPATASPKLGLRQQIMVLAILPFLVVVSATVLYMLYSYHQETHALDEQHVKRSARVVANSARTPLIDNQLSALQSLLDATLDREIIAAAILGPDGTIRLTSGDFPNPVFDSHTVVWNEKNVSARWPIYRFGHTAAPGIHGVTDPLLGWVVVTAQHTDILQNRHHTIAWGLVWALLSILLTIYLGGRINHTLMTRIQQLRDVIGKLDRHQWSTRLPDSDYPDWQLLSEALNNLAQRTQQSFRKLQNEVDHSHRDLQRTLENLEISNMELELARVEALSASQSKSEFLANTSHEVRTPLSGILGFCNVLLEHENNPRRREYLESIRTSAEHLLGVLNDILDLSKIEAGKFTLSMKPFALLPVIEDSARLFAQQAADKQLALVVDTPPSLPQSVVGDPARLKQLLTNLISNAVKFTDHGEVVVTANVEPLTEGEIELRLTVKDTGIGIEPSQQQRLFEAFHQLDGSGTREHGGTGLGLAIVKRLTGLMNGHIALLDSTPSGSTFELRLPLTFHEPCQPRGQVVSQAVLLWDENPRIRTAIRHNLTALNISATECESLDALIEMASDDDTILVGFTSYSHFANWESKLPNASRRVILLPSLAQVLSRQDYVFLQKPVPRHSLYEALLLPPEPALPMPTTSKISPIAAQVLAADDNASNRLLISALMEEIALPAQICESGRQAVERCQHEHYPLIILDLQMPEMSGTETARRIRKTQANSRSYIVALTAHLVDDEPVDAQSVFDEMIEKPLTIEKLQELVRSSQSRHSLKPVSVPESIARASGRRDLARQLLLHFMNDLPATRERWLTALRQEDTDNLAREAHQLAGACSYVSTPALADALQRFAAAKDIEKPTRAQEIINEIDRLLTWAKGIELELLFEDEPEHSTTS